MFCVKLVLRSVTGPWKPLSRQLHSQLCVWRLRRVVSSLAASFHENILRIVLVLAKTDNLQSDTNLQYSPRYQIQRCARLVQRV